MIHYRCELQRLEQRINEAAPGWLETARKEFARACTERTHDSTREYWGSVKDVFAEIQGFKCAYCETPLPRGRKARVAYDVEHHRPKNRVREWPDAATRKFLSITYDVAAGRDRGYPELAHHPLNYAVSCKVCNSPYKGNTFPILGQADPDSYDIATLNEVERPVVPLPIGDWGEPPESIIGFEGFIAVARSPAVAQRAEILIDFFELNRRPDLLVGRATAIFLLHLALRNTVNSQFDAAARAQAVAAVKQLTQRQAAHAGASLDFKRLFRRDRKSANTIAQTAWRYVALKNKDLAEGLADRPLRDMADYVREFG